MYAMRLGLAAAAMLAVTAQSVSKEPVAPEPDDVVVVARKMRLVRLDYGMFGPHLRRCDITKSSGDARVDRIMCALLKRYSRSGSAGQSDGQLNGRRIGTCRPSDAIQPLFSPTR